jgi:hypothetical protein
VSHTSHPSANAKRKQLVERLDRAHAAQNPAAPSRTYRLHPTRTQIRTSGANSGTVYCSRPSPIVSGVKVRQVENVRFDVAIGGRRGEEQRVWPIDAAVRVAVGPVVLLGSPWRTEGRIV